MGLYFSAHWCPPCRGFTPKLKEWYEKDLKAKGLEIVFVSSDRSEEDFKSYYAEQPWLALDFADTDGKGHLSSACKVEGIPSFVIINPETFSIITTEGRGAVSADPTGDRLPWVPEPVRDLAAGPGSINETPSLVVFCEQCSAAEKDAVWSALTPVAQRYVDAAGEDAPEYGFIIAKTSDGMTARFRSLVGFEAVPPGPHEHPMEEKDGSNGGWYCDGCQQGRGGKRFRCTAGCDFDFCEACYQKAQTPASGQAGQPAKLLLIDIPSDGAFYVAPAGEITTASVEAFIADHKAGKLQRKQLGEA